MTLVEIDLESEPACLRALQANDEMTYGDLERDCRVEVINLLKISQNNLCAYCQKSIENVITIEHYIAQTDIVNNGTDLQLNLSNFLGVCTGKFYHNRMTGDHEEHCGNHRRNIALNIDPRIVEHINTVSYTDDCQIFSSNIDFNNDLNTVLNLNINGICDLRQKTFSDYFVRVSENWLPENRTEFYQQVLRDIENNPPEYYGYLKFRFERLLENELS